MRFMYANPTNAYGFVFALASVLVLAPLCNLRLSDHMSSGDCWKAAAVTLIEAAAAYFVTVYLVRGSARHGVRSVAAICATIAYLVICAIQGHALRISENYISIMALDNASVPVDFTKFYGSIAIVGASILVLVISEVRIFLKNVKYAPLSRGLSPVIFYSITILYVCSEFCYGLVVVNGSPTKFNAFLPPAMNLGVTGLLASRFWKMQIESIAFKKMLGDYTPIDFHRDSFFRDPLPSSLFTQTPEPLNVIVIFMEGTSAKLIGAYGGAYQDVTPNLDKFAQKSLVVDNYYNHQAATFRGIHGQLTSGYNYVATQFVTPVKNGLPDTGVEGSAWKDPMQKQICYLSLPSVLRHNGYKSYFLSPEPQIGDLQAMLQSLNFTRVMSKEAINHELLNDNATFQFYYYLSDASIVDAAIDSFNNMSRKSEPFFLSWYNVGTHAFLTPGNDVVRYGDGRSAPLNRLHNYDHHLGRFLDNFFQSEASKRTMLIITADHSAYPEPALREACAGKGCSPYFVDKVPLMIYAPGLKPGRLDADGRTSVDLAPTILHILGINGIKNSFLGHSLFEDARTAHFGVSAIGSVFYYVDRDRVAETPPPERAAAYQDQVRVIKAYFAAERNNTVFPEAENCSKWRF